MYTLSPDEAVFAAQLSCVRTHLSVLAMEERTLEDRLLAILRGHQAKEASAMQAGVTYHLRRQVMFDEHQKQALEVISLQEVNRHDTTHAAADRKLSLVDRPGPCL